MIALYADPSSTFIFPTQSGACTIPSISSSRCCVKQTLPNLSSIPCEVWISIQVFVLSSSSSTCGIAKVLIGLNAGSSYDDIDLNEDSTVSWMVQTVRSCMLDLVLKIRFMIDMFVQIVHKLSAYRFY